MQLTPLEHTDIGICLCWECAKAAAVRVAATLAVRPANRVPSNQLVIARCFCGFEQITGNKQEVLSAAQKHADTKAHGVDIFWQRLSEQEMLNRGMKTVVVPERL